MKLKKSKQLIDQILSNLLHERMSLRAACRSENISDGTFLGWVSEDPELSEQYGRVRSIVADLEFEYLLDLADEVPLSDPETGKLDPASVTWQKNRIDVRKWTLARKAPKKYGNKLDAEHNPAENLIIQIKNYRQDDYVK